MILVVRQLIQQTVATGFAEGGQPSEKDSMSVKNLPILTECDVPEYVELFKDQIGEIKRTEEAVTEGKGVSSERVLTPYRT